MCEYKVFSYPRVNQSGNICIQRQRKKIKCSKCSRYNLTKRRTIHELPANIKDSINEMYKITQKPYRIYLSMKNRFPQTYFTHYKIKKFLNNI